MKRAVPYGRSISINGNEKAYTRLDGQFEHRSFMLGLNCRRTMNTKGESLASLLGLPVAAESSSLSSTVADRRKLLSTPIDDLTPDGVWELLKTGMGEEFLVPTTVAHLEQDPTLFGLLTTLLRVRAYRWSENPEYVVRLRAVVRRALDDLAEWDGTSENVVEAMRQRIPILAEWASFERSLSRIP